MVVGALVATVAAGPAALVAGSGAAAGADPAPFATMTATPTAGLTDGQAVTINVKATAGNSVYQGRAAVCRAGVTYQTSTGVLYDADAQPNGPNCALAPISSSADSAVVDNNMFTSASSPEGDTLTLHVGVGVVDWTDNTGTARSLTCDPSDPCDLLVELLGGPQDGSTPPLWVPFTQTLTYADGDPLTTCGGAAAGALNTGGSDAMVDAWTQWTLDQCKQPGQTGAATEASFVGEGDAVQEFDSGTLDLAYTASGSDKDVGLDPTGTPRPSVAVPVAIGATTVGVGNGYGAGGKKVPYPTISMTPSELATLVGSGQYMSTDQEAPIVARNPDLSPLFFAPSTDLQVGVPSGASTSTYDLSNYLDKVAGSTWVVPSIGAVGSAAGESRGVFNDFGTAEPDFNLLTTYTGRPALAKVLFTVDSNLFLLGAVWVVSDLTTANAESLVPVAIQAAPGGPFVSPTQSSMDAAVADMKPDAAGLLQPDPTTTDANAYPLTYVEYAMVPAQPLVDASCNPRTASQAQLVTWLKYLTGDGQTVLPEGLEPLTPALQAQAATAIAQVGTTPNTCTPTASPGGDGSGSGSSGDGGVGGSSGGVDGSSGGASDLAAGANSNSVTSSGPSLKNSKSIAAKVGIPGFGGSGAASVALTVLALLGVVALITMAARFTSGFGGGGGGVGDAGDEDDFDAAADGPAP